MEIPDFLVQQVRSGKVVLFLGAGASMGATAASDPKSPPSGIALAKLLSNQFLGGEASDRSLAIVAEYCNNVADLRTVQHYVAEVYSRFEPAPFHRMISDFRWAAIATTNYDQVIEKAYASNGARVQGLVPILRNTDRVDYELREVDKVAFLKLHGCITAVDDAELPLILTIDQYNSHRTNRHKLFRRFEELAGEYTVVYVGYRLEDPNLREILQVLEDPKLSRPRHYLVTPSASNLDKKVWSSKRIDTLEGSFQDFLAALDIHIPKALRTLQVSQERHPLSAKFKTHVSLSEGARSFLDNDIMYVHNGMTAEAPDPKAFYKGASYGWSAHLANLDSARNATDAILSDVVLRDDSDRPRKMDAYLLKGHAGAGKTVILKRIAMETGLTYERPTVYLRADSRLNVDAVAEIAAHLGERMFVFLDGAARRPGELETAIKNLRLRQVAVTLIMAERTSEWNVECQALDALVDDEFEIRALAGNEIVHMLGKLKDANALGVLATKTQEEQLEAFHGYADRQLLVALYEITSGKSFEDIVFDEYKQIASDSARRIYLTVCALNRLGVPVRAGLVHRVTDISLSDFKREFFKPLESIVLTENYAPAADLAYRSRHPSIAQIVFEKALPRQQERFELFLQLLDAIDVGYGPDRAAYRELVRARNLMDLFSDPKMIDAIFEAGHEASSRDGYLFQQCAIFEMKRVGGDLARAQSFLATAKDLLPYDKTITHSFAELEMARASVAGTELERKKFIDQAKGYAQRLTGATAHSAHGYSTLVRIELEKLQTLLKSASSNDNDVIAVAKALQQPLQDGLQHFRNDPHLLTLEAEFHVLLSETDRAEVALKKANAAAAGNIFVALALARLLESREEYTDARDVLKRSLQIFNGDKRLNAAMGKLIQMRFPSELSEAEAHWRRSFTAGDTNYYSQFWYARALYINGKIDEAFKVFSALKTARIARDVKLEIAGWLRNTDGKKKRIEGSIARLEDIYAWVTPFGHPRSVYLHRGEAEEQWSTLHRGDSVTFALGFNYMGPAASIRALSPRRKAGVPSQVAEATDLTEAEQIELLI